MSPSGLQEWIYDAVTQQFNSVNLPSTGSGQYKTCYTEEDKSVVHRGSYAFQILKDPATGKSAINKILFSSEASKFGGDEVIPYGNDKYVISDNGNHILDFSQLIPKYQKFEVYQLQKTDELQRSRSIWIDGNSYAFSMFNLKTKETRMVIVSNFSPLTTTDFVLKDSQGNPILNVKKFHTNPATKQVTVETEAVNGTAKLYISDWSNNSNIPVSECVSTIQPTETRGGLTTMPDGSFGVLSNNPANTMEDTWKTLSMSASTISTTPPANCVEGATGKLQRVWAADARNVTTVALPSPPQKKEPSGEQSKESTTEKVPDGGNNPEPKPESKSEFSQEPTKPDGGNEKTPDVNVVEVTPEEFIACIESGFLPSPPAGKNVCKNIDGELVYKCEGKMGGNVVRIPSKSKFTVNCLPDGRIQAVSQPNGVTANTLHYSREFHHKRWGEIYGAPGCDIRLSAGDGMWTRCPNGAKTLGLGHDGIKFLGDHNIQDINLARKWGIKLYGTGLEFNLTDEGMKFKVTEGEVGPTYDGKVLGTKRYKAGDEFYMTDEEAMRYFQEATQESAPDGGSQTEKTDDKGCGCNSTEKFPTSPALFVLLLMAMRLRRREKLEASKLQVMQEGGELVKNLSDGNFYYKGQDGKLTRTNV
jgi:hypothetical protein